MFGEKGNIFGEKEHKTFREEGNILFGKINTLYFEKKRHIMFGENGHIRLVAYYVHRKRTHKNVTIYSQKKDTLYSEKKETHGKTRLLYF